MRILVDVAEAAKRLEELIELSLHGDEIVICRDDRPVAMLMPIAREINSFEESLASEEEGHNNVPPGTISFHSEFRDEHGLPK